MTIDDHPPGEDLRRYLELLARSSEEHQFLDVRWLLPQGHARQQFTAVGCIEDAVREILQLAEMTDVFVGVALRDRRRGGKAAISGSHLLYIECDKVVDANLQAFAFPPTAEIASGTPGHCHLYWRLNERVESPEAESANRRLAQHIGGELGCVDISRVLRPPETVNYKHHQPRAVRLLNFRPHARYSLPDLLANLPEDPRPPAPVARPQRRCPPRNELEQRLLAIPAADYVRVLTGREPDRAGKVLCPFHEERRPSLQLYPDGTFYCYGASCRIGGTIIDFAAALWGMKTKGQDFNDLCERLAERLALRRHPARNADQISPAH